MFPSKVAFQICKSVILPFIVLLQPSVSPSIQCTSTFLWDSHAKEDDKHPPPFLLLLLFHIHAGAILSRSGSPSHQYRGVRLNCKMFILIYSTWYHLSRNFGPIVFPWRTLYDSQLSFFIKRNCKVYKCAYVKEFQSRLTPSYTGLTFLLCTVCTAAAIPRRRKGDFIFRISVSSSSSSHTYLLRVHGQKIIPPDSPQSPKIKGEDSHLLLA